MNTNEPLPPQAGAGRRWRVEDIDFSAIDVAATRANETLFYLACSASFVESGSDLYTRNLVDYFSADAEVTAWLRDEWEHEEMQHGHALRAYVQHVWPEFPWERAFADFLKDYSQYCKVELLGPTPGLELSARCVVETGTSTYYRALARAFDEPVFRTLSTHISNDEVSHYKYFYKYFRLYREREKLGRWPVFRVLLGRVLELRSEDADCALRNIVPHHLPDKAGDAAFLRDLNRRMSRVVSSNLNASNTLKMFLRPLELPPKLQSVLMYPIEQLMQRVFLRV